MSSLIDKQIEVLQALKEGKGIEWARRVHAPLRWEEWRGSGNIWDWGLFDYRVKKEPVRVRLFRLDKDHPWSVVDERFSIHPDTEVITVEQVDD